MSKMRIEKVLAVPPTPTPDTLYLVLSGGVASAHLSNHAGDTVYPLTSGGGSGGDDVDPFLLMGATNG